MISRRRLLLSAAAAPLVLAGCKVRTINYFPVTPATVRFVNVMYPAVGLDGVHEETVVWTDLGFEGAADYVEFDNNQTTFGVRVTGTETNLGTAEDTLTGQQPYSLIAWGRLGAPGLLLAPDARSGGTGNALVRVINVGLGAPAIDVYVTAFDQNLDDVGPNFGGVGSGQTTIGLRLSPGTYRIRGAISGSKVVIYDSGTIELVENTSTNLLYYTLRSANLLQCMLLPVSGSGAGAVIAKNVVSAVKVVNAALNAGTIDGFLDGAQFVDDVAYAVATDYQLQTSGAHTLTFEATSTAGAAIASLQQTLESASDISVLVVGFPGAVQAIAFADDNISPLAGQCRMRFVNASSDNAAYDVYVGDTKVVSALAARTASDYATLVPETYTFTFRDPASGATVLTVADQQIGEGRIATLYLAGAVGQLSSIVSTDR
jgi:hypothetical protein